MNDIEQLARMQEWLDTHPSFADLNAGPRVLEDEDTLRVMRGLSASGLHEQRRPRSFTPDELGYLPNGSWTPDGEAA